MSYDNEQFIPSRHRDTETLAEVLADTLAPHQVNLRLLWRDLANEGIELGTDWPFIARTLFADMDRLAARIVQARAGEGALREACVLEPAENMALTVAWAQVERGEQPMGNVAAVCVMALERIRRAAMPSIAEGPA